MITIFKQFFVITYHHWIIPKETYIQNAPYDFYQWSCTGNSSMKFYYENKIFR